MPTVNDVGEPCAGEPHARFDGRGLETGGKRYRTAPAPDPTPALLNALGATEDLAAMHAFRAADIQVGGGHLYSNVVKYLKHNLAPRLFEIRDSVDTVAVFGAASSLTEMAGWM